MLHGFKSFAKRTEIVFSNKFNVVLGPNGSGKSNVLDALTFVLGKSSSKALRAEKSANLIYNGGKKKEPARYAEVSLYFDNSNLEFPSEEKEIKITRIVTASGQSKYRINDKPRTRQQILDLMSIAKINPDGYNIVLQGDITNFCNMTTTERRMMIEEISGISVYEEKKNRALLDLQKVEANIREAEIILSERKTYLKELKRDRDQALRYKEMSEKVDSNKATLLHLQIENKKKENARLGSEIEEHKGQIAKYESDIAKLKEENAKRKLEIDRINREIEERGEREQLEVNRQVEVLKIEITKDNSRIAHIESEAVKIDLREKELARSIGEIDDKVGSLSSELLEIERRKAESEKEKAAIDEKIIHFRKKHNLDSLGTLDRDIEDTDKKIEEAQKLIGQEREKQQELIRRKDQVEYQLNTMQEQIDKVRLIEREHKAEIDKIKQKREEFKKTTLELNGLLSDDSRLSASLVQSRKKLLEANDRLAEMRLKENSIQHSINADIAVKKILELKDKRHGIYNTVSELGSTPAEFSLALEIAAGPRIKSIVVEDDKVASDCIKYLKAGRLGTATFLPLNKIKGPGQDGELERAARMKGVKGFAINLIKFDARFRNVFSYVFGNTLVVDSIDVAREVGIGKCKMVTIDGDYCDVSGAMQGGFRQKKKEALSFKEDELSLEIAKLESAIGELSSNISAYEKRKSQVEDEIVRLRNFKAELEGDIIKTERSLHIGTGDLDATMKSKKELEKEKHGIEEQSRELNARISKINSELAGMKAKRQQVKERISMLRSPALIAELNAFEQKKQELSEEAIILDSQAKSIGAQRQSMFSTEKENIDRLIRQLKQEREDYSKESKRLRDGIVSKDKALKEKEARAREFYAKFKEMFNQRSRLDSEINANDVKINGKQQKSRDIEIKLNIISLNNAKTVAELSGLEQEFKQYEGTPLLKETDEEALKREVYRFEKMREEIGSVNMKALEIYDAIEKEYNSLLEKKDTLDKERLDVANLISEIDKNKKELFMKNFTVINDNFQKIFLSLSTKGQASLELENSDDPFQSGVDIKVRIIGTKFLDIKSLSGGEKTMTALAFLFAIQEHDPAEFYILDEVDAALDKKNSESLADLIQQYCAKAQYIVISHNDGIISKADTLFGISMDEHGISKATSLRI